MSLLNEETCTVILDFRLPPEFHAPADGVNETIVSVKVFNSQSPINIKDWHRAAIFDAGWKFDFPHHYGDVGVRYQVNVQILHDQIPLLIEQDYFVTVNNTPHRQTLHLSPIGFLYVEAQEAEIVAPEEAVTISLHEAESPEVELVHVKQDEQSVSGFYLKYDPDSVIPGKRYALTGIENRYHQRLLISPEQVELAPAIPNTSALSFQKLMQWLEKPLRLFTDAGTKIR